MCRPRSPGVARQQGLRAAVFLTLLSAVLAAGCASGAGESARAEAGSPPAAGREQPRTGERELCSAVGRVERAGMTSWMYGSHVLIGGEGKVLYALKSGGPDLGPWEGRRVRLHGEPVEGYPVDGGPSYLRVIELRAAGE